MNELSQHPILNARYEDARGRILIITRIQPDDPLGREVLGKLKWKGNSQAYATTLKIFYAVWVKKVPPLQSHEQRWG